MAKELEDELCMEVEGSIHCHENEAVWEGPQTKRHQKKAGV